MLVSQETETDTINNIFLVFFLSHLMSFQIVFLPQGNSNLRSDSFLNICCFHKYSVQ